MLSKLKNRKKGFTLIALMIVVAIIGILAAIAIPSFMRFAAKSKQAEAKTILAGIYTGEESYFAEQNTFGTYASIGFSPASPPKYYTTGYTSITYSQTSFTVCAIGNIDSDAATDVWCTCDSRREPQNNGANDV